MKYKQARLILLGMAYDFLKGQELLSDMIYTPLRGVGIIRTLKTKLQNYFLLCKNNVP